MGRKRHGLFGILLVLGVSTTARADGPLDVHAPASGVSTTINGQSYKLIPEILALTSGAPVPPEIYAKYDSRLIGGSLVSRFHKVKESEPDSPNPEFDYIKDTLIQHAFNSEHIYYYIKNGFPNQFRVGASDGALDTTQRSEIENKLADVVLEPQFNGDTSDPVIDTHPIYAFLTFLNDNDGERTMAPCDQYGNIIATLKDEVKLRSTFTPADSLDTYAMQGPDAMLQSEHSLFIRTSTKISKNPVDPTSNQYWEAQVWGHLGMGDVAYFLVNCPDHREATNDEIDALKLVGAPIYKCVYAIDNSHMDKGELVYPGDPAVNAKAITPVTGSSMREMQINGELKPQAKRSGRPQTVSRKSHKRSRVLER